MILLLDENLPRKLKYRFSKDHEILTVPEMGWSGIKNGELLKQMQAKKMKYLVTLDKNFSFQQNLETFNVYLIVLSSKDTRYSTLLNFVEKIERALKSKQLSRVIIIE